MEASDSKGASVRAVEKLLLEPWQSIFRIAYGFCLPLVITRWRGEDIPWWEWALLFLVALVLLRVLPMGPRKVLPFSKALKSVWFDQRQLAKRYDSYQWAKLLWIGIGIGAHAAYAGRLRAQEGTLALACILAGGLGTMMWLRAQAPVRRPVAATNA
jgi:hypothetical protein